MRERIALGRELTRAIQSVEHSCTRDDRAINRNFRERLVPLALDTDYLGLSGRIARRRRRMT